TIALARRGVGRAGRLDLPLQRSARYTPAPTLRNAATIQSAIHTELDAGSVGVGVGCEGGTEDVGGGRNDARGEPSVAACAGGAEEPRGAPRDPETAPPPEARSPPTTTGGGRTDS